MNAVYVSVHVDSVDEISYHLWTVMFDVRSFKISKNDHIIDVQQFDDIDFVCPYYPAVTSRSHRRRHRHHEYYVIYRVSSHVMSHFVCGAGEGRGCAVLWHGKLTCIHFSDI